MSAPTVTVVIPTHARAAQLEACLGGIAKLNSVPGGFEIVVVDDGGPQSLEPLIASWRDRLPVRLTGGSKAARQRLAMMGPQWREGASSPSSTMTVFRSPAGSRHW
jgi:glycosyltransferase involved in cell wall biosynthesis